ncbi:FAD/NAD(P)-binding protein [Staphylococcus americanisciuri]|uniref:FAD/NAD(P)-binding protein n=1 Tax=Staphylococcus americanisciuri TaxID=2973940 RepID=A0ABT2EZE9_9STAP|nr:FAD/NAD(P)-binding protein [Staphylococcus americanisciuri]MCS4485293.1 FAD/NAD(P)-binding protein [Staphylococcus americanisciuri]
MNVAIIGMGTAGVSVLRQLVKHQNFAELNIDIYDNATNMGQGEPFQNDSDDLLINIPVDMLSLNIDNIKEFREWYEAQTDFDYGDVDYLPRFVFGHYMKSYLNHYVETYDNIHVVHKEVSQIAIEEQENEATPKNIIVCVGNAEKTCRKYDYVFLTIGTMSYNDPYKLKGELGFIHSPYPANHTLEQVQENDEIAVIGTGLASLDVIRYVLNHHNKKLLLASRSGQLPSVRGDMIEFELQYLTKERFKQLKHEHMGVVPLDDVIALFHKECEALDIPLAQLLHRKTGDVVKDLTYDLSHPEMLGKLQSVLMAIKDNMDWIWNSLMHEDQQVYLERYHQYVKENSNPMPRDTAELILNAIDNGMIEVCSGLEYVERKHGRYQLKFGALGRQRTVDVVINATGPKTRLDQLDESDALLLDMANRHIVQSHPMGGIQIKPETNEVISSRYGTLTNLCAIGQITNGVNFQRNAVTMIVQQAVKTVGQLYQYLERQQQLDTTVETMK